MVEHLDLTTRATLLPDARQPVENPDYAAYAESYAADKARYESLIAAASDEGERRRLQDLWQEDEADWQRRLTQGRYLLSPETIAAYTDFAPQLCPLREVSMLTAESGFSAAHSLLSGWSTLRAGIHAGCAAGSAHDGLGRISVPFPPFVL